MKCFTIFGTILALLLSQTGFANDSRISLTASDGTGLELHQLEARVVLDGFLAFTELEMVFYNPENRQREGRFQIILPDNAAISRFAMKIGERLQEGEVVEKQLARRAYEDFLHRRQDPALLEMDSGNRFNARIFPIAPKSEKLIILSYSQRLVGENSEYILPLKGLPKLKQLSVKVFYDSNSFSTTQLGELTGTVSKREVLTIDKRDYQPTVDFRMPYQAGAKNIALQKGQLVAARITPFTEATSDKQGFDNLIVFMDTSASQAPYLLDSLKRLENILPSLKVGTLQLYAFDQVVKEIGRADNLSAQKALIGQLKQYNALGASRIDSVITTLKALKLKKSRLLLISDAVATAGETSAAQLAAQLKTIAWLERVDILIPSYHNDKKVARSLAKSGKSPGIVAPLTLSNADIIRKLTSTVYADVPIKMSGSTWFWPEKVEALQTNEPLIVFGELSSDQSSTISISVGDKKLSLTSKSANPILLKREWVRARLDKLLDMEDNAQNKDMKSAFHNEIINLSVKKRVLSPYTSLLVLETEADYRRYKIDRRGLADILTIGVDGITVIKRAGVEIPIPVVVPIPVEPEPTEPSTSDQIRVPSESRGSASDSTTRGESIELSADAVPVEELRLQSTPSAVARSSSAPMARAARAQERRDFRQRYGVDTESDTFAAPPADEDISRDRAVEERHAAPVQYAPAASITVISSAPPAEEPEMAPASIALRRAPQAEEPVRARFVQEKPKKISPWTGKYAEFRALLDKGDAGDFVQKWHQEDLSNVMALIALGEWYEKTDNTTQAARAYSSLIDYFPARADIRRWAAERLLSIKSTSWLSIDSLKKAVEQRSDHPSGHYLLAIAYWEAGQYKEAVETLQAAMKRKYPRFAAANRILMETLAIMLTRLEQQQQLETLFPGNTFKWEKATQRQLRLVLMWETDANDVDFHIYDNQQHHAFYRQRSLPTGGTLYADITTGYGPECFSILEPKAFPYKVQANYYSMGPMGYGMGVLHVLDYDLKKGLHSEFRPFVVMKNQAFVELGKLEVPVHK
jgi:tetratricopeptide (TPR) repeat protein